MELHDLDHGETRYFKALGAGLLNVSTYSQEAEGAQGEVNDWAVVDVGDHFPKWTPSLSTQRVLRIVSDWCQ